MNINDQEKLNAFDGTVLKTLFRERQRHLKAEGQKASLEVLREEVADKIHSSKDSIKRWESGPERGGHPTDYTMVLGLAKEFGVDPEVFEKFDYLKDKDKVNSMNEITTKESSAENITESTSDVKTSGMSDSIKKDYERNNAFRDTIISVYHDVSDYLETYRKSDAGNSILAEKFNSMFRNFKRLKLEIPSDIYIRLEEFMTEYLFMLTGIDSVLPLYLKDLIARKEDIIEFISDFTIYCRIKMNSKLWEEYLKLKEYVVAKNSGDIPYKDHVSELTCTYEFEEETGMYDTEDYDFAALYLLDLYHWIDRTMELLWISDYDLLISNSNHYKSTCVSNAYAHLNGILAEYIPR